MSGFTKVTLLNLQEGNGVVEQMRAESREFIQGQRSTATDSRVKNQGLRFQQFLWKNGENRKLSKVPIDIMDDLLTNYTINLMQGDGKDYQPNSVQTMISSVRRHLKLNGVDIRLLNNVTDGLKAKKKNLKGKGHGNKPNIASEIDNEVELQMWRSGALGDESPRALLQAVW